MPNIQLRTGKTVFVSTYEFYFKLKDDEVEIFLQSCEADNLGIYIDDPFTQKIVHGTLDIEETDEDITLD